MVTEELYLPRYVKCQPEPDDEVQDEIEDILDQVHPLLTRVRISELINGPLSLSGPRVRLQPAGPQHTVSYLA